MRTVFARSVSGGRSFIARIRASASCQPHRSIHLAASQVGKEQRVASASRGSRGAAGSRSRTPRRANARSTAFTNALTPGVRGASATASFTAANDGTRSRSAIWYAAIRSTTRTRASSDSRRRREWGPRIQSRYRCQRSVPYTSSVASATSRGASVSRPSAWSSATSAKSALASTRSSTCAATTRAGDAGGREELLRSERAVMASRTSRRERGAHHEDNRPTPSGGGSRVAPRRAGVRARRSR